MHQRQQSLEECAKEYDVQITSENVVRWNPASRDHPRNWKAWSKCYTICLVIWLEFYMTLLSSSGVRSL